MLWPLGRVLSPPVHDVGTCVEELFTSKGHIKKHIGIQKNSHPSFSLKRALSLESRASRRDDRLTRNLPAHLSTNDTTCLSSASEALRTKSSTNADTLVPRERASRFARRNTFGSMVNVTRVFIVCILYKSMHRGNPLPLTFRVWACHKKGDRRAQELLSWW